MPSVSEPPLRLRALIVEDEARQQARLLRLLAAQPDIDVVGTCSDGRSALTAITALQPDLLLLDVQIPERSGLDVLEALPPAAIPPAVVFVTAYDQYALRAFELHALDYLLKPFDDARFARVLERARARVRQGRLEAQHAHLLDLLRTLHPDAAPDAPPTPPPASPPERLAIKVGSRVLLLNVADIDWIGGAGVYVELHVGPKRYPLRETLNRLEARLDARQFVRIHRSTMVNLHRVQALTPSTHGEYLVHLREGPTLKLSRSYRHHLKRLLGQEAALA